MIRKIIIARSYGFCMGVKRAIKIAEETAAASDEQVTILNEIVHNEAVVEDFRRRGVAQKFSVAEINEGTVIVSAHGFPPQAIEAARTKGLRVVDATCPLVTRIYNIIRELVPKGFYVIHFGDPAHDETKGVVGHAPERITVISRLQELTDYPDWPERKLVLTVQTTMSKEDFNTFRKAALKKWPQLEVRDTICNATGERQAAIRDLARRVDMVLVVGSEKSANSKRLADISRLLCHRSYLIGSGTDISEDWFRGDNESVETVGISAGASTPDFLVNEVIEKLVTLSGGTAEVVPQETGKITPDMTSRQ